MELVCSSVMVLFLNSAFLAAYGLVVNFVRVEEILSSCVVLHEACVGVPSDVVARHCGEIVMNLSGVHGASEIEGRVKGRDVTASVFTLSFSIPSLFVLGDPKFEYYRFQIDGRTEVHSVVDYNANCAHKYYSSADDEVIWKPGFSTLYVTDQAVMVNSTLYEPLGVAGGDSLPNFPVKADYVRSGVMSRSEFHGSVGQSFPAYGDVLSLNCGDVARHLANIAFDENGHYSIELATNLVVRSRSGSTRSFSCSSVNIMPTSDKFSIVCDDGLNRHIVCSSEFLDWDVQPRLRPWVYPTSYGAGPNALVVPHGNSPEMYSGSVNVGGLRYFCDFDPFYSCQLARKYLADESMSFVVVIPPNGDVGPIGDVVSDVTKGVAPEFNTSSSKKGHRKGKKNKMNISFPFPILPSDVVDVLVFIIVQVIETLTSILVAAARHALGLIVEFLTRLSWRKIFLELVDLVKTLGVRNGLVLSLAFFVYSFSSKYFGNTIAPLTLSASLVILFMVAHPYIVEVTPYALHLKTKLWDEL